MKDHKIWKMTEEDLKYFWNKLFAGRFVSLHFTHSVAPHIYDSVRNEHNHFLVSLVQTKPKQNYGFRPAVHRCTLLFAYYSCFYHHRGPRLVCCSYDYGDQKRSMGLVQAQGDIHLSAHWYHGESQILTETVHTQKCPSLQPESSGVGAWIIVSAYLMLET